MALVLTAVLALLIVEDAMPRRKTTTRKADPAAEALLKTLNPHAAGIDVGARELWVAVPPGSVPAGSTPPGAAPPQWWRGQVPDDTFERVRRFGTFTADLQAIARWLRQCGVTTVAMESTGVYWIALYDLLPSEGFEVFLVDPRQTQRAPGRPKTDKQDSMWIQRLHGLGLLTAAFRPEEKVRVWRSYQRHRANLVDDAARQLLRLQKALEQMNVKLTEVVSDITGVTGLSIVKAILAGERDPRQLAKLRDPRCQESEATIARPCRGPGVRSTCWKCGTRWSCTSTTTRRSGNAIRRWNNTSRGWPCPRSNRCRPSPGCASARTTSRPLTHASACTRWRGWT